MYEGPQLATTVGSINACMGGGMVFGGLLGGALGPKNSFLFAGAVFAFVFCYINAYMEETLPPLAPGEEPPEISFASVNPLRFLALFRSRILGLLSAEYALQSLGDYAVIYDTNFMYTSHTLGWGGLEVGRLASAFGASQMLGREWCEYSISQFGIQMHTLLSNVCTVVAFTLFGNATSTLQVGMVLAIGTFMHQRSAGVNSTIVKHATHKNRMGRAEVQGALANLVALVKIIAPIVYSRAFVYTTSAGRNMPGSPYFIVAGAACAARRRGRGMAGGVGRRVPSPGLWTLSQGTLKL